MTRRRAIALAAVWLLPSAILVAYVAVVYRTWRIEVPPRLGPEARAAVVASLRAALDGQVAPPTHAETGDDRRAAEPRHRSTPGLHRA